MFSSNTRETKQWVKAIRDNSNLFAMVVQGDVVTWASHGLTLHLGRNESAIAGHPVLEFMPEGDWSSMRSWLDGHPGVVGDFSFSLRHANGAEHKERAMAWRSSGGEATLYYVAGHYAPSDEPERAEDDNATSLASREEMLTYLSHEIRTPMNALTGLLELLRSTSITPEQEPLVSALSTLSAKLLMLLNDMLDLSRVRAGKMVLHYETFALRPIMDRLLREHALLHPNLQLKLEYDDRLPAEIRADSHRIEQMLTNVLSNALKFTKQGQVTLIAQRGAGPKDLVLAVRDTGTGVSPAMLSRLFDPFISSGQSSGREAGTGLGLHIAKLLAELHGGRVHACSEEGRGTEVRFELPVIPNDEVAAPEQSPDKTTGGGDEPPILSLQGAVVFPTGRKESARRILLVDDNAINVMVVNKFIARWGYEVDVANDGKQALDMLEGNAYGLVLMDIRMPVMGGIEATERIRARKDAKARVPVVALTASTETGIKERIESVGMDGYIFKPFIAGDLQRLVEYYLGPGQPAS